MKKTVLLAMLCLASAGVQAQSQQQLRCARAPELVQEVEKIRRSGKLHPKQQEKLALLVRNTQTLMKVHAQVLVVSEAKPGLAVCAAPEVNALVMEGGKDIFVFAGMVEKYGHEPGWLAAVIAHEIGHIARKHFDYRRNARDYLIGQAQSAAYGEFTRTGDVNKARQAAVNTIMLGASAFSRAQELDADGYGTVLLTRAGFDPKLMAAMMERMLLDRQGEARTNWLATHPGWNERLASVEPRIQDEESDRLARSLAEGGDRRALARQINAWLARLPDSGNAWFHKAEFLERVRNAAYLEAYSRALTAESPQISRREGEIGELWLRLCSGLYHAGHKLESAHCSRYLKDPELQAKFRDATFGPVLFVHGTDTSQQTLVAARDAQGRRLLTNDPSILSGRAAAAPQRVAPWRPLRFPPDDVDRALPER